VVFKISIDHIDLKKKLSQNRDAADRAGILRGLGKRGDDQSRAALKAMQKNNSSFFSPIFDLVNIF
jgi:predicted FMN-binding regulatory protein PaiB